MNGSDLPVVRAVVENGPTDRVYDTAMVVGVLLLAVIASLGRTMLTEALVVAYLVAFTGYIAYNGLTSEGDGDVDAADAPGTR